MRILIATDSFPPGCGGSGWSTFEVARGLRDRGHDLVIVQPIRNAREPEHQHDGFRVRHWPYSAPDLPYVRNYFKNERLSSRLATGLRALIVSERIDVIHGQHVLTGPPSIAAARAARIPSVCTIRDYWPVCYWSDLILDYGRDDLCPRCSPGMMTTCIRPRAGAVWPLATVMIPYMTANLGRKRRALADATAIVAVSSVIAGDLRQRAPEISGVRLEIIPNPVDVLGTVREASSAPPPDLEQYVLYVGKLAPNKGVGKLWTVLDRAGLRDPLVIIGDGPERHKLETEAARDGRRVIFKGWLPRPEVLAWLRRARLLVFPSQGPESLSRVLLEAAALGVPIAAMDTGGSGDIIRHDTTGLLSHSAEGLAADVARLANDPALAARLGAAASAHVTATFDTPHVIDRLEDLYRSLTPHASLGLRTSRG